MAGTCCLTGHRIIPVGEQEKILARLRHRVDMLYGQGYRYFGVGGALGFDMLATDWLLEYKRYHTDIRIIEVLPFPEYRDFWTTEQKNHGAKIDWNADKIVYCSESSSREAYLVRNRHLVDCSTACISYCTHPAGGTAYTVKYALSRHIPVYNTSSFDVRML